jgi:hypothetical protein
VCSKRVEGAGAPQDETMVLMERNEGRSKEGDAAGLNTSLLLGARGDSFVAGAYSSSPQLCGSRNLFLRNRLARISTFKQHEVGRIWATKRAWPTVSERKGA